MSGKARSNREKIEESPTVPPGSNSASNTRVLPPGGLANANEKRASDNEPLSPEEGAKVVALWKEGRSQDEICGILKATKAKVRGALKRHNLLDTDPRAIKAEVHDPRMKMAQEDQETRTRLDAVNIQRERNFIAWQGTTRRCALTLTIRQQADR